MRLFIAHFILVEKSAVSRKHYISSSLFAAATAEDAYNTAQAWVEGYADSTHSDEGELVRYYSSGLYDLEEASVNFQQLQGAITELYGVQVGHVPMDEPIAPIPKAKDELEVFRAAQPFISTDALRRR